MGEAPYQNKEWLQRKYEDDGLSTGEIGDLVGVHRDTILYWLRKHGIPRRTTAESLHLKAKRKAQSWEPWLRAQYVANGRSARDLAKDAGVDKETIVRYLRLNGIEVRGRAESVPSGSDHPLWSGGRYVTEQGYVMVKMPNHPQANGHGYVAQHRVLMERKIGRRLTDEEVVHHINEVKSDNRPENLMLLPDTGAHTALHHQIRREERVDKGA